MHHHSRLSLSLFALVGLAPALATTLATTLATKRAFADDADPTPGTGAGDSNLKIALSIERLAGVSYATATPQNESSAHATFVTLGGAIHNPLSMPRAAFDVYLPSGLGFGIGLGFSSISPSSTSHSGIAQGDGNVSAYVVAPRIAYRVSLSPTLDLIGRLGVTLVGASVAGGDQQSCVADATSSAPTCRSVAGNSDSVHALTVSPEVVGALRLTASFNLLAGLGYDQVFAASASSSYVRMDGSTGSHSNDTSGTYSSLHLWFGMGGYL